MDPGDLERRIAALPAAARREVEALVGRLEREHAGAESVPGGVSSDVQNHPFVGTWADREDVTDSVE